jgi:hypothetical protein
MPLKIILTSFNNSRKYRNKIDNSGYKHWMHDIGCNTEAVLAEQDRRRSRGKARRVRRERTQRLEIGEGSLWYGCFGVLEF